LLTVCHVLPQVIQAYNRILDLKEKHVDVEVLQILVNAACSSDAQGDLKKRAEQLLTRLTQQASSVSSSLQIKYQWLRFLSVFPRFEKNRGIMY
jgi:hypothetical protein